MSAENKCKWTARLGWPALAVMIVLNPDTHNPLRLVFVLLTVVVPLAWFASSVLPHLLGDYEKAIRLGVVLGRQDAHAEEPPRLRAVR